MAVGSSHRRKVPDQAIALSKVKDMLTDRVFYHIMAPFFEIERANEKSAFLPRCGLKDPEGILKAQVKKWEEVRNEKRGQTANGVDWAAEAARSQQETFQGAADDEFDNTDYEIGVGKDKAVGGRGVAFAGQGGAKTQQQGGDEGEEVSW